MSSDQEWAEIELHHERRVEAATLLQSALAASDHALRELRRCELRLITAIRRAQRARRHSERCGELLQQAIRLRETVG